MADRAVPVPDTGSLRGDLVQLVESLCRALTETVAGRVCTGILLDAQDSPQLAAAYRDGFLKPRREVAIEILRRAQQAGSLRSEFNLELTADLIYGPVWYRHLVTGGPLNRNFAKTLVDESLVGMLKETRA
jgi:hypothetical protein